MDSKVQQCRATEAFENGKNVSLSVYEVPHSFVLVISCTTNNLLVADCQLEVRLCDAQFLKFPRLEHWQTSPFVLTRLKGLSYSLPSVTLKTRHSCNTINCSFCFSSKLESTPCGTGVMRGWTMGRRSRSYWSWNNTIFGLQNRFSITAIHT